jgi:hypothetical protein
MDVRLTREHIPELKARGAFDARVRTRGPSSDWVAIRLAEPSDLPPAIRLVEEAIRVHRRSDGQPALGTD